MTQLGKYIASAKVEQSLTSEEETVIREIVSRVIADWMESHKTKTFGRDLPQPLVKWIGREITCSEEPALQRRITDPKDDIPGRTNTLKDVIGLQMQMTPQEFVKNSDE